MILGSESIEIIIRNHSRKTHINDQGRELGGEPCLGAVMHRVHPSYMLTLEELF